MHVPPLERARLRVAMALVRSSSLMLRGKAGREASASFSSVAARYEGASGEPQWSGDDKEVEHTTFVIEDVGLVLVARLVVDGTPVVSAGATLAHVAVEAVARDGRVLGEGTGVDGAFSASHDEQEGDIQIRE